MNYILIIPYFSLGLFLAFCASNILAMGCCAFVALSNIFSYHWAWLRVICYLLVALITWWLIQLCLTEARILGDAGYGRFHSFIFVGLIFSGFIYP